MDAISFESYKIRQSLIEEAQDKIFFENISGSEKSKKSGYEIAQETFKLSKLMNEGLSKISDESERKQKSDEYYLLLNMIDFLEDKIVKIGGNLKEIYNQMELQQYKEVFTLTISEIQLLLHLFWKEEQLEWLKQTSMLSKINPFNIFCELLSKSKFEFSKNVETNDIFLTLRPYTDLEDLDCKLFIDSCYEKYDKNLSTHMLGDVTKDEKGKCYYKFKNKHFQILDHWGSHLIVEDGKSSIRQAILRDSCSFGAPYINELALELKVESFKIIKNSYERKKFLEVDEMQEISEFQDFISKFNCEIILNNLRILHNELSMAYKNLKFQEK